MGIGGCPVSGKGRQKCRPYRGRRAIATCECQLHPSDLRTSVRKDSLTDIRPDRSPGFPRFRAGSEQSVAKGFPAHRKRLRAGRIRPEHEVGADPVRRILLRGPRVRDFRAVPGLPAGAGAFPANPPAAESGLGARRCSNRRSGFTGVGPSSISNSNCHPATDRKGECRIRVVPSSLSHWERSGARGIRCRAMRLFEAFQWATHPNPFRD